MKLTTILIGLFAINLASSSVFKISIDLENKEDQNVEVVELGEPMKVYKKQEQIETEIFDNFLKNFNIKIKSLDHYEMRKRLFLENYRKIREHNERYYQGLESFEMGVNHFTHLTKAEKMSYLSQVHPSQATNFSFPVYKMVFDDDGSKLADNVDWVAKNKLQPIQDQGQCGSCYVFSAIATIEAQMIIHHNNWVKLSEQEAMECTRGCNGGYVQEIYTYSNHHGGCASENSYPYQGQVENDCEASKNRKRVLNSKCSGFLEVGTSVEATMKALEKYRPVTATFAVYDSFFSHRKGVYEKKSTDNKKLGYHAVALVGYGQENGKDYWLFRNSWGTGWGEEGYGKFLRGHDECQIESLNHYAPQF